MSDEMIWAELARVAAKEPVIAQIMDREGRNLEAIYGALLRSGHSNDELVEMVRDGARAVKARIFPWVEKAKL